MRIYCFVLFLTVYSSLEAQKETFEAQRIGYFHATLEIRPDSTYSYSSWNHTGQTVKDSGKLICKNGILYLNSTSKTRQKSANGKGAPKFYLFQMQQIEKYPDKILIPPCEEVFPEYCTYYIRKQ